MLNCYHLFTSVRDSTQRRCPAASLTEHSLTEPLTTGGEKRSFVSSRSFVAESFATPSIGPRPVEAAHLSSLPEHESRAHQVVPASDHSAWTVPLVSFDPASSDQRDGARESAHQTRARPQGSRGGRRRPTPTGTPNDRRTSCGFLLRRARPSVQQGA